jgi:hypothetical protein
MLLKTSQGGLIGNLAASNSLKPPGCPALILLITGKGFPPFKCLFLITVGNTF